MDDLAPGGLIGVALGMLDRCRECQALPGERCVNLRGNPATWVHVERFGTHADLEQIINRVLREAAK